MEFYDFSETDEGNMLKFTVSRMHSSMANALRRIMISDVPTMAIERVSITENNGLLPDEMVAHRLGLLPIRVLDPDTESEGPKNSESNWSLKISFDPEKADDDGIHTIYSGSVVSEDPGFEMVHKDIIITKLITNHQLDLTANAVMGTGYEHSKWSPCSGTSFRENEDTSYTFNIETTGSLKAYEVFRKAIFLLREKLSNISNI
jgi:DNA-directed RNA polymerase alpha subunit